MSLFGNVISTYSRAEAIADGVLIDAPLNGLAKEAGIRFHCAMTAGLFGAINPNSDESRMGQDLEGRLWDMLTMFKLAARKSQGSEIRFSFLIQRIHWRKPILMEVIAHCGPGDNLEPVITFMLPERGES